MAESYIVTGKTVEEALAKAQKAYAGDDNDISTEIIDAGKKGFMGIGAREAKIRVTVSSKKDSDLSDILDSVKDMKRRTDRDGYEPRKKPANNTNANQNTAKSAEAPVKAKTEDAKPKQNNAPKANAPKAENNVKAENTAKAENSQPKAERPAQQPQAKKPNNNPPKAKTENNANESRPQNQPKKTENVKTENEAKKPERTEKPVIKAEKPEAKPQNNTNPAPKAEAKAPVKVQTAPAPEKKSKPVYEHSEVVVAAPVGLFDMPEKPVDTDGFAKINAANAAAKAAELEKPIVKPVSVSKPKQETKPAKPAIEVIAEAVKKEEPEDEEEEIVIAEEVEAEEAAEADEAAEAGETETHENDNNVKTAVTEEEMECALAFANTLLGNMQINAVAKRGACPEGETFETTETATVYPRIEIEGEGTGILIGHHGETLDAIQYLVNLSAVRKAKQSSATGTKNDYVKIVVDVEDYRIKREETLRALARRMAQKAVRTKKNIFLEPMNAYERRIIHSELQSFENVSTHSVGTDKNRKIIITYEGPDKVVFDRTRTRRPRPEAAEGAAENSEEKRTSRPRPRKRPKMPIDKLNEVLPSSETESEAQNTVTETASDEE